MALRANSKKNGFRVVFIDLHAKQQRFRGTIKAYIPKVLDCGRYITGSEIKEIESKLAVYVEVKQALAWPTGTEAVLTAVYLL